MLFLPPGFSSEAEVRSSPLAQAFLAGQPLPVASAPALSLPPVAAPAPPVASSGAPGALRIAPLDGAAPSATPTGALRIRPLDDFLAALPTMLGAPAAPSSGGGGGGGGQIDPRHPQARAMPPEVAAALQGTLWATESGRQRAFWDTQDGAGPIGPNTDLVIGTENGQWQTIPHPLFPNGSPAYMALIASLQGEGGRWGASPSPRPGGGGGISDTFTADPNFQGMSKQDLVINFGNLAGRSPFAAALGGLLPPNPFKDNPTPADVMGTLSGFVPMPWGTLMSVVGQAGFQAAINDAMREVGGNLNLGLGGDGSGTSAGDGGAFHTGGRVGAGPPAGPERRATLLEGEFVVRPEATRKHRQLLEAINRGESRPKLKKLIDYLEAE